MWLQLRPHRDCHGLPFGYGAEECIAAGWQAANFDLEEWTGYQGCFGTPSVNNAALAIGLVVFPDRHDWEA